MNRCLFLDRDGVINEAMPRGEYLLHPDQFKLLPGIKELIDTAKDKGYLVVVVTNQPQISRGFIDHDGVKKIHKRMKELLPQIDAVYYCPHHNLREKCECRKPLPGMLLQAGKDYSIDFSQSYILGDSDWDIGAGKAAGTKTIFIKNEHNSEELKRCEPNYIIAELKEAESIL